MPRCPKLTAVLFALATWGLVIPPGYLNAAAPTVSADRAPSEEVGRPMMSLQPQTELVQDIVLAPRGILVGQIMDMAGQGLAHQTVTLAQMNQTLVETKTDEQGRFAIQHLRGGVYQLQIGSACAAYRLWAPGTAPPSASEGMLVIVGEGIERGQFARDIFPYGTVQPSRRDVILGALIGAAIFVPLYTGRDRNPGS